MYLNGESILSEINFEKSPFNCNYAELTTNNLQELPSHLDLSINYQIMPSHYAYDQISQKSSKLLPYRIIQQGKVLMTNKLMIPSNQKIAKNELYNPQQQKFTSSINELSIQFKNRFNESLFIYINSTCQIIESIYDINKQTRLKSNNITLIQFNQPRTRLTWECQFYLLILIIKLTTSMKLKSTAKLKLDIIIIIQFKSKKLSLLVRRVLCFKWLFDLLIKIRVLFCCIQCQKAFNI